MSTTALLNLPTLRRCHHCQAWQRDAYELCLFCGGNLTLGRIESALRLAPLTVLIMVVATAVLIAALVMDTSTLGWMGAVTFFVAMTTAAVTIAPRHAFAPAQEDRRRPDVALQPLRKELKAALARANRAGDPAHVTPDLTLLLRGLTLLRHGNRAAPLIYGSRLARDARRSKAENLKGTIEKLNQLDHDWVTNRLSSRPNARTHILALAALLKAVKGRPLTWVERLREHDLGAPMPFIDIEPQLSAFRDTGRALEERAIAASSEA